MTYDSRSAASNPFRPNLDQQKKRAKELRRAVAAGDPPALARVAALNDRLAGDPGAFKLADAQWVIARELKLPSWPALKAHITSLDEAEAAIASSAVPDGDMPTLHIRCGNDIAQPLRSAGIAGAFLEYSNPLCDGPVVSSADWLERRIHFVADAYARWRGEGERETRAKLEAEEAALQRVSDYGRVALWFEHDSYDQLILIRLLSYLADCSGRPFVEIVATGDFPGAVPFWGLGQLPPEALRLLWERRSPVTEAQFMLGARAWDALRAPNPKELWVIAEGGAEDLPFLSRALFRHLQELPDVAAGLSLTHRIILTVLHEHGPMPAGRIFSKLMRDHEPLPWLGDLMFWHGVHEMSRAGEPPLLIEPGEEWPRRMVSITAAGRDCLEGRRDYLSLDPPPRWLGGVEISGMPSWRWDAAARCVARG